MNKDSSLKVNTSHILSPLAEKLGASIFGGFEDEKDFYLMIPTFKGLKVGDVIDWGKWGYDTLKFDGLRWYTIRAEHPEMQFNKKENTIPPAFYCSIKKPRLINNLFQEYARTGIIENDLYKHFFDYCRICGK